MFCSAVCWSHPTSVCAFAETVCCKSVAAGANTQPLPQPEAPAPPTDAAAAAAGAGGGGPQPAECEQPAAAAAGAPPQQPSQEALQWSQRELSQVPLAEVQLLMQQGAGGLQRMNTLQALQINASRRQRAVNARQQQRRARQQEAAAEQQQAGPRRSGRIAQQQEQLQQQQQQQQHQGAPPQPPPPQPEQPAPAAGPAALQPVVEGPGFPRHDAGGRTLLCSYCHAKLWPRENKGTAAVPHGGSLCCYEGKNCTIPHLPRPHGSSGSSSPALTTDPERSGRMHASTPQHCRWPPAA